MSKSRYFIDTNIFVYCFDNSNQDKKSKALELISNAMETRNGVISYQVIQEFLNVGTRKFSSAFNAEDLRDFTNGVLYYLWEVYPDKELFDEAQYIRQRYGFSFYDSLIIASAIQSGCTTLFSEDLQTGQKIKQLTIINPFS